jgi:hypothetical protein
MLKSDGRRGLRGAIQEAGCRGKSRLLRCFLRCLQPWTFRLTKGVKMHPNVFLNTFWRMEVRNEVFVAMSFDPRYQARFDNVIAPAIRSILINGIPLQPYRVDLSKSGDSILTEIDNGIAHSRLVLADVSTIGKDSSTGHGYRNANVLYEVGLALACRQPHEVLLIRDDNDRFLFDVSTIPHATIDFTDEKQAISRLREELMDRLREANLVEDARVLMALASLSGGEINLLKHLASLPPTKAWLSQVLGDVSGIVSVPRLLDKQLISFAGETEQGYHGYHLTPFGHAVAKRIGGLPKLVADVKEPASPSSDH